MGAQIELNYILRLKTKELAVTKFAVGEKHTLKKDNTRIYPIDMPILLVLEDWAAIGYCAIRRLTSENQAVEITFEVLTVFTTVESEVVTRTLVDGLKKAGYL